MAKQILFAAERNRHRGGLFFEKKSDLLWGKKLREDFFSLIFNSKEFMLECVCHVFLRIGGNLASIMKLNTISCPA